MAKVLFQGGVEVVRHKEGGVWQAREATARFDDKSKG
jgi:hypothetical protein